MSKNYKKNLLRLMAIVLFTIAENVSFTRPDQVVQTVFAHAFPTDASQADIYREAFASPANAKAVTFADVAKETSWGLSGLVSYLARVGWDRNVTPSKAYFGQGEDIETLDSFVNSDAVGSDPVVLFGASRGSSAIINYLAKYNPKNIKAIVLTETPANLIEAWNPAFAQYGFSPCVAQKAFATIWSAYPADSTPVVDAIKDIKDKKLPVMIMHSQTDAKFPFANALKVYAAFKDAGFENVYLAAGQGRHAKLMIDDKENYMTAVHSFYKKHGIEHNQAYATANMQSYVYDRQKVQEQIDEDQVLLDNTLAENQKKLALYTMAAVATTAAMIAGLQYARS